MSDYTISMIFRKLLTRTTRWIKISILIGLFGWFLGSHNNIDTTYAQIVIGAQWSCDDIWLKNACENIGWERQWLTPQPWQCICNEKSRWITWLPTSSPTAPDKSPQSLIDLATILDTVMNFMYVILRPLIAITGLALDNSLVYWWAFSMSDLLFKMWRIMTVIAYMILVWTILYEIASWVWSWKDLWTTIKGKLIKWVSLWVLIPLSWSIIAVLVDFSTILIYQVWGIPLTLLEKDVNLDKKLLETHSTLNLSQVVQGKTWDATNFRSSSIYTCGGKDTAFIVCKFDQYVTEWRNGQAVTQDGRNEFIEQAKKQYTWYTINPDYCVLSPTELLELKNAFPVSFNTIQSVDNKQAPKGNFEEQYKKWQEYLSWSACGTISQLIDQSKWMVWPLYTIYSSLLNFWSLNVTDSNKSTEAEVMLFMIKALVWLCLIFPLIALWLVSIARIWLLWIIIAFSPLLMFMWINGKSWASDELNKQMDWWWRKNMGAKFKTGISDVLALIFQPVITVLALSLSIVLLSVTTRMIWSWAGHSLLDGLGLGIDRQDHNGQSYQCLNQPGWYGSVCLSEFNSSYATTVFFDYFTWIIVNILGILIMWNILFNSLKRSKMTWDIASKVQDLWKAKMETMPLFFGKSKTYLDEWQKQLTNTLEDRFINDPQDADTQAGKDAATRLYNRSINSAEQVKHNKKFYNDDLVSNDENAQIQWSSKALAGWIWISEDKYTGLFADKSSINKWGDDHRSTIQNIWPSGIQFKWSWLTESIWDPAFWYKLSAHENGTNLINKIWQADFISDENNTWINNKVWPENVNKFKTNWATWIKDIMEWTSFGRYTIDDKETMVLHNPWGKFWTSFTGTKDAKGKRVSLSSSKPIRSMNEQNMSSVNELMSKFSDKKDSIAKRFNEHMDKDTKVVFDQPTKQFILKP